MTRKAITWTSAIVPGVYIFEVFGYGSEFPGDTSKGFCTGIGRRPIVVLPGDRVQAKVDELIDIGQLNDNLYTLVVYGVARPNANIRLLGFVADPPCGARVSSQEAFNLAIRRDSVGYHAYDTASRSEKRTNPILALEVQQGSKKRFVRIASTYTQAGIGFAPSVRFDVTPAVVRSALAGAPNSLLCL